MTFKECELYIDGLFTFMMSSGDLANTEISAGSLFLCKVHLMSHFKVTRDQVPELTRSRAISLHQSDQSELTTCLMRLFMKLNQVKFLTE